MKRFYEVWFDMGFCCLLVAVFLLCLLRLGTHGSWQLMSYDLVILLVSSLGGGFVAAMIVTVHEEREKYHG